MTLVAVAGLVVVAGLAGAWVAAACPGRRYVDRLRSVGRPPVVAALAALTIAVPAAALVVAPVVAWIAVSTAVTTAIARRPVGALATLDLIGAGTRDRRAALGRDLLHHRFLLAWRMGAAIAGSVLLSVSGPPGVAGAAMVVASTIGAAWPRLPAGAGIAPPPGSGPIVLEAGRDATDYVVGIPGAIGVAADSYLYRALAGWNLGLGLDDEQATWAGHLARRLGLGPVLADPAPLVDDLDARRLAICRAIASDATTIVLENPLAGMPRPDARRLASLLASHVPLDRLVILDDPSGAAPILRAYG